MRYGVQHINKSGEVCRTRVYSTLKLAMESAPIIKVYGNDRPNPDDWRVVELLGTIDEPQVGAVLAEGRGHV